MHGETFRSILERLFEFSDSRIPSAVAEAVLELQLAESDQTRMGELAGKSNLGTLSLGEAEEYDDYIAAADLLSLWKSKARQLFKSIPLSD